MIDTRCFGECLKLYSWLSRCCTARVSSTGLLLEGPTKVKARNSFLFTVCSLKVVNKDNKIKVVKQLPSMFTH